MRFERIENSADKRYDFVNLSMGPRACEDDDVHAWTSVLDDRFGSDTFAAVAVGRDGRRSSAWVKSDTSPSGCECLGGRRLR